MGVSNYDIATAAFRRDRTQDYELSILTGVDSFAYIIRDRTQNQLLAYRSYSFGREEQTDYPAALQRLIAADERLQDTRYGKTVLAWDTPVLTLVPAALYTPGNPTAYLDQLTVIGLDDEVRHEHFQELDGELIYAARRDHIHAAEEQLHALRTQHYGGALLTAWGRRSRRLGEESISCSIRDNRLFLAGHRNGALLYFNTFRYDNSQDGVYYLLLAFDQCGFTPDRVPLYLSGEVTTSGELYNQFYRYVEDVRFSAYPTPPAAPPELSGLPPHLYFDLLCLG
ncbi:hypothetical protein GGR26_000263 [Lewinella marina]|uniref:DUF3822 domain-containing protein n=1 Tax=Neolewinella marina TaxID=438751 RepID=A0A2G0CK04_9BACT|nr:DUF3822 family protein [Neolewinella marina]NJB84518.1 hypothetical protein [Neolewinella marina]PHL00296.1 hypothetical protein CGL56_04475 [Neolewinella marina]